MNKEQLLNYLYDEVQLDIEQLDKSLSEQEEWIGKTLDELDVSEEDLNAQVFELYSQRERSCVYPPANLPATAEEMIPILRKTYKDDVTKISLILHHYFPDDYLFYRVSKLETEIFHGFDFFSEVVPVFDFQFERIRRTSFDDYLTLNSALRRVGRAWWPDVVNLQARVEAFLYHHLAMMFLERSDYNRYWICSTHYDYWHSRHQYDSEAEKVVEWSGRKDMRQGDLVFLYCSAPVKAITDVYSVHKDARFDPRGGWDGFWVDLAHLCDIPDGIPFAEMRKDPVLSQWSVIRRQFQGVVTESVPHSCYNRLVDLLGDDLCGEYNLEPEPVSALGSSGAFASEEEFEDTVIEPLLKGWALQYRRQFPCKCYFGTQQITGYVDFLVSNQAGVVTLFEDKLKIVSDEQLEKALKQGKSYALMLGLPSFVIASPEGCRLYSLDKGKEALVSELRPQAKKTEEEQFLSAMLKLQKG